MFDNKLQVKESGGRLHAGVVISGIAIAASEPIDNNPKAAFDKVMNSILSAVEFFPLKDIVGIESFTKAVELFVTTKNGTPEQKKLAASTIKSIVANARKSPPDPTAQDIDYALARLGRQMVDAQFNKRKGDFLFDGLGFSPVKLRKNLDQMAKVSEPMREAKSIFTDLSGRDGKKREKAIHKLRSIKQRVDGGDNVVIGRVILMGVTQYIKANNASAKRERLFGNENVTVGFSYEKLGAAFKKAAINVKTNPVKALAKVTLGPKANNPFVNKAINKNPMKTLAVMTVGPKSAPFLWSPKGKAALDLMIQAKRGSPAAKATVKVINAQAKAGNPAAQESMNSIKTADAAINQLPPAVVNEMRKPEPANGGYGPDGTEDYEEETPVEESFAEESFAEDSGDSYDYRPNTDDEYNDAIDGAVNQILLGAISDQVGFNFGKLIKSATDTVKNVATKAVSTAAKAALPLATAAANAFAPGMGSLISKALPALLDTIPSDKQPEAAQIARGMDLIKKVDEMDPAAVEKLATIKKLAAQGVPQAEVALNALKVAKGTQQIAETIVTAQGPESPKTSGPQQLQASPFANASDSNPIPVRIVQWGR